MSGECPVLGRCCVAWLVTVSTGMSRRLSQSGGCSTSKMSFTGPGWSQLARSHTSPASRQCCYRYSMGCHEASTDSTDSTDSTGSSPSMAAHLHTHLLSLHLYLAYWHDRVLCLNQSLTWYPGGDCGILFPFTSVRCCPYWVQTQTLSEACWTPQNTVSVVQVQFQLRMISCSIE